MSKKHITCLNDSAFFKEKLRNSELKAALDKTFFLLIALNFLDQFIL